MEDLPIPQQPIPSPKKKESLIFLLITLIVALFSGFFVYFWQQSSISSLKSDLANQQLQIQQLQKESKDISQTEIQPVTTSDSRILLTPDNIEQYNKPYETGCDIKFNYDKPSTTVTYQNSQKGLSVELPYNPSWGNDTYKINPYDEDSNSIRFGYIIPFEACGWTRWYRLKFLPVRNISQIEVEVLAPNTTFNQVQKINLSNNLPAIRYAEGGLCNTPSVEIVGEKYNYKVIAICESTVELDEDYAFLETIANSIKLIK